MTLDTLLVFPIAALLYFLLPHKMRNGFLLLCSYGAYIFLFYQDLSGRKEPPSNLLVWVALSFLGLLLLTAFNYGMARAIESAAPKKQKRLLTLGIVVHAGLLIIYKLIPPLLCPSTDPVDRAQVMPLLVMVGLSFYTFQAIGYLIDVKRGTVPAQKNQLIHALFLSFFPQIVSGPIARADKLMPQFLEVHNWDYGRTVQGMQRMLVGFVKKIAVSTGAVLLSSFLLNEDNLAFGGPLVALGVLFNMVYVYADFSGYCDIAIGAAHILGFTLAENFKAPLLSSSISDLWNRWHITLTSWFRDYVYIPLGGSRRGFPRKLLNIAIVFLVSGLWHNVGWSYLIWGALHAFYRILEELLHRYKKPLQPRNKWAARAMHAAKVAVTFSACSFAYIFFRNDITQSLDIAAALFRPMNMPFLPTLLYAVHTVFSTIPYFTVLLFMLALGWMICDNLALRNSQKKGEGLVHDQLGRLRRLPRWALYFTGIALVAFFYLVMVASGASTSFAYGGY